MAKKAHNAIPEVTTAVLLDAMEDFDTIQEKGLEYGYKLLSTRAVSAHKTGDPADLKKVAVLAVQMLGAFFELNQIADLK